MKMWVTLFKEVLSCPLKSVSLSVCAFLSLSLSPLSLCISASPLIWCFDLPFSVMLPQAWEYLQGKYRPSHPSTRVPTHHSVFVFGAYVPTSTPSLIVYLTTKLLTLQSSNHRALKLQVVSSQESSPEQDPPEQSAA